MMSPANIWMRSRASGFSTSVQFVLRLQSHPLATLKPQSPAFCLFPLANNCSVQHGGNWRHQYLEAEHWKAP